MSNYFTPDLPFTTRAKKSHIKIEVVSAERFSAWYKKQSKDMQTKCDSIGFKGKNGQILVERDKAQKPARAYCGISAPDKAYDWAELAKTIAQKFSENTLKTTTFECAPLAKAYADTACLGWGLNAYNFDSYKSKKRPPHPALLWPKSADKTQVESTLNAIFGLRDLINIPANDMGPEELEAAVKAVAKEFEAKVSVIKDKALLDKNFPLVYTVGQASTRAPRLIELTWGNTKHPKIALVGKGVVFDTGGLDLKPSQYMRLMKKDMGGAAHTLALAYMIMANKLPVHLQLIIPAVENAVAGNAFRPGDIIKSRKGLYVENTNTDAEGRLILADALTYACEKSPELVIDFATLTGSARAALGPDIPAFFSTNESHATALQKLSPDEEDPVWNMPLWQPYRKHIEASEGDLVNSAGLPGDLIYSALFLHSFLDKDKKGHTPDWMHFDCHAWELGSKAGRPKGGADTGLRSVYKFLQNTYGK